MILNYKKHHIREDMEYEGEGGGKSDKRVTKSKTRKREALHCAHV
jgi:hypothetical protein